MNDYTSREDEDFFGAIGRLTISWAHLEFGLDCIVEIIHHGFGGKNIESEIPRALQRKIAYLRAAFRNLPFELPSDALQGYQNLFDQVQTAAQTRHDIIHGIIIEHAERSGEATMVRAIRNRHGVTKKQFKVTTRGILKAAVEAEKLGAKVLYWVNEIHDLVEKLSQQGGVQEPL